ncbi:hypothetical protein HaLaN_10590 [Haematococcus lacustris]|uniref:Uncharacterized protein n=1 Tax=Haematococcus lacustris TaxID=44745 RepID=A0A699YXX9_HAELA|nr:hypothetical protein HaLaN_10590 [Haematococcus lacustris]
MRSRSNSAASSKGPLESLRDELLIATPSKAIADRNTTGSDGSFEAGRCSSHRSSLPWGSDASSVALPKHTVASDAELGTSPVSCTSNSQLQISPDDMLGMPSMEAEWPRLEVDEEQMVHGWSRSSGLSSTVDPAAYTFVLGLEQTHALTSGDGGSLSSAGSASAVGLTAQAVSEALAEHTRASSKVGSLPTAPWPST